MKQIVAVCFVLCCLASCINVDDFGAYWDKASRDPRLLGKWKRVAWPSDPSPKSAGQIVEFVDKGSAYAIDFGKSNEEPLYPVKTLQVGPYNFLAAGPKKGFVERYKQHGDILEWCYAFGPSFVDFIEAKYPKAANITRNHDEGKYAVIKRFDSEVFDVLSHVPDTHEYWFCDIHFVRTR